MKFKVFKTVGGKVKRAGKTYGSIWFERIIDTMTHLVAMRHFYGSAHEGEFGLAIAGFVKEAFKSIGAVRRVSKLSSTPLGKTYISYTLLSIVKEIDKSKVKAVLNDISNIRDLNGLEFFEGIRNIIDRHFDSDTAKAINRRLNIRISNAIVSEYAVYDPIAERMVARDPLLGELRVVKMKLKGENAVEELYSYGLLDKSRDIYVNYAEWRMLKIIDEGVAKGFSGKALGQYVFTRLRDELRKDSYFFEAFKYYLAKHMDKLQLSEQASAAFGELLIQVMRINRRLIAAALRSAANVLPMFGGMVEVPAAVAEGMGELGEALGEAVKKSRKERSIRTVKVELGRQDDLFRLF